MYKLTEKENYLRLLNGEVPEYLPKFNFFGWTTGMPVFMDEKSPDGYTLDEFGVEYTTSKESMGGMMPAPGRVFMDDITKWRDLVKLPDLSAINWEMLAKDVMKNMDYEHNPVVVHNGGYFMTLMNMMGFMNGLCAMIEEPEEVQALFEYLNKFFMEKEQYLLKYFHADIYQLADDTAAMNCPFIDLETYQTLIKPYQQREADMARNAGMKISMHDCGKCEIFIPDWIEMGVCSWDPAQVVNDLDGIKARYGNKLVINGGWDNQGPISYPTTSDDELRQALRDYIDRFAPGGGFAYMPSVVGSPGEEAFDRKMGITAEVYRDYGRDWYKNHQ